MTWTTQQLPCFEICGHIQNFSLSLSLEYEKIMVDWIPL